MTRGTLLLLAVCLTAGLTQAGPETAAGLRIATWNLEHLAEKRGAGCRPRQSADYRQLRGILQRSGADIIAFQEVDNSLAAAHAFDPEIFWIEISDRPATRDPRTCRTRRKATLTEQRTGFAIRKSAIRARNLSYVRLPDFRGLGIEGSRWGTQIELKPSDDDDRPIRLLSVHLKSGCAFERLNRPLRRRACKILKRQRGILEAWIDEQAEANRHFIIVGDFNRQLDQPRDDFWQEIDDGHTCSRRGHPTRGSVCNKGTEKSNPLANLLLANAGKPFPFPHNARYPYAVDHFVLDSVSATRIIDDSYRVLDYRGADPAPSDHHLISIDVRLPFRR